MNSFLDLWINDPHMANKITDLAFFFVLVIVMSSIILFKWMKVRKRIKEKENALYIVIMDLCNEPIENLKEFKENIKKAFKK